LKYRISSNFVKFKIANFALVDTKSFYNQFGKHTTNNI